MTGSGGSSRVTGAGLRVRHVAEGVGGFVRDVLGIEAVSVMNDLFKEVDELPDFLADGIEIIGEVREDGNVVVVDAADFVQGFVELLHLFMIRNVPRLG